MQLRLAVKAWRFNKEADTGAAAAAAAAESEAAERVVRESYQKQVATLRKDLDGKEAANLRLAKELQQSRDQCEQLTVALDGASVHAEEAQKKQLELEATSMQNELSIELNNDAVVAKEKAEAQIMRVVSASTCL